MMQQAQIFDAGSSNLVLCDNLVGEGDEWEGGSRGRGHMYTCD